MTDRAETRATQRRYNRIAPLYDAMETAVEKLAFDRWRTELWSLIEGERVLEVGVGTGKNLRYHPDGAKITAIDLSNRMMARARRRARAHAHTVQFAQADAQHLPFADGVFDTAVATFVFCSVPDAIVGLEEVKRVVRGNGQILLLEHVRINTPLIGPLMDLLDPFIVKAMGAHIARRTVENVTKAGLEVNQVTELAPGGLVKLIRARVS